MDGTAQLVDQGVEVLEIGIEAYAGCQVEIARRRAHAAQIGTNHLVEAAEIGHPGLNHTRLAGIDLVPERVEKARARLGGADIREGDASELPFEEGAFDVVLQSMMFSSILDASVKRRAAAEMARVLAPGGLVLWYDFFVNNPRNPNVRGVGRREVEELFPGFDLRWRRVTLAPPLVRALAPRLRPLAGALQGLRVLNTHALADAV